MVINDAYLEAVQFTQSDGRFELVGLNRISLEKGVIERGAIKHETAFQQSVQTLFSEAVPQPIKAKHLYINIPFSQVYPFIKTFPHHSKEEYRKSGLMELVEGEVPFNLDELEVDYDQKENTKEFVYQVCAYSKTWCRAIHEACSEMGFEEFHFIPEPVAQMVLSDESETDHYALFSWQEGSTTLSLFYNGLLYDTFVLKTVLEKDSQEANGLLSESQKVFENFEMNMKESVGHCYFAGFPSTTKKVLKDTFEDHYPTTYLKESEHTLSSIIPVDNYSTTLVGLALNLLKKNDE